jgi:hypothetical protein
MDFLVCDGSGSLHKRMNTIPYNSIPRDHYREWVSTVPWNHGVTIQPGNPRYTADDMECLADMSITSLGKTVRVRNGLWICFIREQSRVRGLWHLHGLIHLQSRKRASWLLRQGESRLLEVCREFAKARGSGVADPSIDLFASGSAGLEKWESYINKQAFRDTNSDRWLFGRPQ